MKTYTFQGRFYRAQLLIIQPNIFSVYILGQEYNKSTAFRGKAGRRVYYGYDIRRALAYIREYTGEDRIPRYLNRYLQASS